MCGHWWSKWMRYDFASPIVRDFRTAMSWFSPNNVIDLTGRYTLQADRTADDSSKTRGGGLCIYVNKAWCTNSDIVGRHCSPNLEFLMVKCRPFYLLREFTSPLLCKALWVPRKALYKCNELLIIIITAAYIPPDANAKLAMNELHAALVNNRLHTRRLHLLL